MRRYARTWATLSAVPALVGAFLCLAMVPVAAWVPVAVVVAAAMLWAHHASGPWADQRRLVLPGATATTAAAVLGVLATWGWGSLMPVLAAVFALAIGLGAMPILASVIQRHGSPVRTSGRRPRPPAPPRADVVATGPDVTTTTDAATAAAAVRARLAPRIQSYDDAELCRCWRVSYTRLQRAAVEVKPAIVLERQLCLDEMLRRYPSGTAHWLRSGARAAGDPTRHLIGHDEHSEGDGR